MISSCYLLYLSDLPVATDVTNIFAAAGDMLEAGVTPEPAEVLGVPEFSVLDDDESANDENGSEKNNDDEEDGGRAGADACNEYIEL